MPPLHPNERNADRHARCLGIEPVAFAAAVGAKQQYTRRVLVDLIFTVKIGKLLRPPEDNIVVTEETFSAVMLPKEV